MIPSGHTLVVGASGAGKTVTAKGIVEQLLDEGRHTCIIDPTGVWHGLRTLADGEQAGFNIPIFGGMRGDVQINSEQGKAIGSIIAGGVSAILDLSQMDSAEQHQLVHDLIAALRSEKPKGHFNLVVDEADEFAPQTSPSAIGEAVKRKLEWTAKRGRVQGFVLMAITQRPADIAKSVISQMQTLMMHQLIAPADQNAIKSYLKDNADKETLGTVMGSLAGLDRGERWVYSPRQGVLERDVSPLPKTFDSSRTPEPGEDPIEPKMLAELDLGEIRAALAPIEAEDEGQALSELPATHNSDEILKRDARIAALEKERDAFEQRALTAESLLSALIGIIDLFESSLHELIDTYKGADAAKFSAQKHLEDNGWQRPIEPDGRTGHKRSSSPQDQERREPEPPVAEPSANEVRRTADIPPRHQRILNAVAWATKMLGQDAVERNIVAWFAKTSPKSSGFQNDLGAMRTAGFIEYPARGQVSLTQIGGEQAIWPATAPRKEDLLKAIKERLEPRFCRILDALWNGPSLAVERWELADEIGMSASSSGFQNDLGKLRTLGLIDYPRPGLVGLGRVLS